MSGENENVDAKLIGDFKAEHWAKEFVRLVKAKPEIATDEATMIAWFSGALMTGYDHALKEN